jgi:hypothetical protein
MIWKCFLPFHGLPFPVLYLSMTEALNFDEVLFIYFSFIVYKFGVLLKKIMVTSNVVKIFYYIFFPNILAVALMFSSLICFELIFITC